MEEKNNQKQGQDSQDRGQEFLRLFLTSQKRIFYFIITMVPNVADADDIMQETAGIMWRKFYEFEPGTNFTAWAMKIARNKILQMRDKQNKQRCNLLSEKALEEAMSYVRPILDNMERRMDALDICLKKLQMRDQQLIRMRYENDIRINQLARQLGRSADGLYKSLARIHRILRECVKRTLSVWERA